MEPQEEPNSRQTCRVVLVLPLINHAYQPFTNASQGSDGPGVIYVGSAANYTDFTDNSLGQNMYADLTENILEESNVLTINTGDLKSKAWKTPCL